MLNKRDKAQGTAAYKNLRNTATAKMRMEKKIWEEKKLNDREHNASTLWSNLKSWFSWGNSGPPTKLFQEGIMVTTPARLAWSMNNFFISKVKQIRERIPPTDTDPLKN